MQPPAYPGHGLLCLGHGQLCLVQVQFRLCYGRPKRPHINLGATVGEVGVGAAGHPVGEAVGLVIAGHNMGQAEPGHRSAKGLPEHRADVVRVKKEVVLLEAADEASVAEPVRQPADKALDLVVRGMAWAAHKDAFHVDGDGGGAVDYGEELVPVVATAEPAAGAAAEVHVPGLPSTDDVSVGGPAACVVVQQADLEHELALG